jgi:hypothetical protein
MATHNWSSSKLRSDSGSSGNCLLTTPTSSQSHPMRLRYAAEPSDRSGGPEQMQHPEGFPMECGWPCCWWCAFVSTGENHLACWRGSGW